ncbi:unnamed protein product [Adineta steineri]|uniref:Uncharacterized protein n=1 Tax=Adineta steineri TaxID=433720 RepID=A0A813YLB0_9BILA|nr:unnamed protein product [Adineta steineri]
MLLQQRWIVITFLLLILITVQWNKDDQSCGYVAATAAQSPAISDQKHHIIEVLSKSIKDRRVLESRARAFDIVYMSSASMTKFVQFKRCQSQTRDVLPPSLKLERQSTNMTYQPRLPTFHTVAHEQEQKRTSDFRRRQIYALNHLMGNLEQEKFRQFCELNKLGTKYNNNDDTNQEILT